MKSRKVYTPGCQPDRKDMWFIGVTTCIQSGVTRDLKMVDKKGGLICTHSKIGLRLYLSFSVANKLKGKKIL